MTKKELIGTLTFFTVVLAYIVIGTIHFATQENTTELFRVEMYQNKETFDIYMNGKKIHHGVNEEVLDSFLVANIQY